MQQTPLHVAASSDKYEIARLLLAKGANISARGAAFLLVILPATFFFFFLHSS
jgi:ankyrin repeat protein